MTAPQDFSFEDGRFGNPVKVRPEFTMYANGSAAIQLVVHGNQTDTFDGEPWGRATVNVPGHQFEPGRIVIKNWAEGEGLADLLVKAGVLKAQPPVERIDLGHVQADVFELTPEALEASEEAVANLKRCGRMRPC